MRNPNQDHHFYSGALAKWHWVDSMEVTEAEFDAEVLRAKHGVALGPWPHPAEVTKAVEDSLREIQAGKAPPRAAIPDVTQTILDGGLGVTPPSAANACALIGSCAAGTVNTIYAFTDPTTVANTLVGGPVAELAAYMLSQPNKGTVYVVPCTCSTAGTCGSTSYTRVGTPSVGTITASGAAYDAYKFVITIVTGEASVAGGGGTFTLSQDNGNTTSGVIAIPTGGTYAVPGTNVTLTFAGTTNSFNAGDVATFSCTAPYYSGSDFTTAFNALKANSATWRFVLAVGAPASASAAATFASTFQSLMSGLEGANRYAYGLMQANDTDANCESAFASFVGNRVGVAGRQANITSILSGDVYTRDAIWAAAARIATRPISEDAGCVEAGPLTGVVSLVGDENQTPGLDAARFITLRTFTGLPGFWITSGYTMALATSDFHLLQNRQVMDVGAAAARARELQLLSKTLKVNPPDVASPLVPGAIDPVAAITFQSEVNAAVRAALNIGAANSTTPGDAVDSTVVVNQSVNILSTSTLLDAIRITPNGYDRYIQDTIGFQ